jgi:mannose-6-phosphate isomerase-like protein (cupin superfamily)
MSGRSDADSEGWKPARPDVAHGVVGKTLFEGAVKVTIMRVHPGGAFTTHRDAWGHLFHFLSGVGQVRVGEESLEARPDVTVRVSPGEAHSYENTGEEDLVLVSLNIPA